MMRTRREDTLYRPLFPSIAYEDIRFISLGMGFFSALCLTLVVPLCYVQITNLIRNTTTHERFAANPMQQMVPSRQERPPRPSSDERNSQLSDASDTNSMLLQPEEQWALFSGTSNTKSEARPQGEVIDTTYCCGICTKTESVVPSQ
jgi:hypothetical protein